MQTFDVNRTLRDTAYMAVGFGILGFQRAQVRRREVERGLRQVEQGIEDLGRRLPEPAREAFNSVRTAVSVPEEFLRWAVGLPDRPTT
jgi:hypothetical protein